MAQTKNCVAHRYRPTKSLCKSCGKGICEECERVHSNLCPSCANVPGGNSGLYRTNRGKKAKGKGSWTSGLPSFKSLRLSSGAKGKVGIAAALVLTAICILLVVLGAQGIGPFPFRPKQLASQEADQVVRQNLYLTVAAIDAYRKRTGELPKVLADIGMAQDATLSYQPVARDRYVLSQVKYGKTISYDSNVDPRVFFSDLAPPVNPSVRSDAPPGK